MNVHTLLRGTQCRSYCQESLRYNTNAWVDWWDSCRDWCALRNTTNRPFGIPSEISIDQWYCFIIARQEQWTIWRFSPRTRSTKGWSFLVRAPSVKLTSSERSQRNFFASSNKWTLPKCQQLSNKKLSRRRRYWKLWTIPTSSSFEMCTSQRTRSWV